MRAIRAILSRVSRDEEGFTIVAAVGATFLVTMLVAGALAATNRDLNLTRNDLDTKRAFAAAQAGIANYSFHLNSDANYWSRCTSVPGPSAVNQAGSTTNRRPVGSSTDETFAIELLPASGQTACSTTNPVGTMIEPSGPAQGTFRIRSTGYTGDSKRSIVATFKKTSLLDYVYFTQLETSDPVTYGAAGSPIVTGAYQQCSKFEREGRYSQPIPGSSPSQNCNRIYFVNGELVKGPVHTNDAFNICGNPTFGRTPADAIEVSSPPVGWSSNCTGGGSPIFTGTYFTNAAVLTPPPTNAKLATFASGSYEHTGQIRVVLNGNSMTITTSTSTIGPIAFPAEGVLYVRNGNCSTSYSPFTVTYPTSTTCGNVRVSGTYSGQLTIAAENDIIVDGAITRTGGGLLGLIANKFVRVMHPVTPNPTGTSCSGAANASGTLTNLRIDAAILALNNSFIVDHYNCGASLGTLTVNGAIGQKYRGPVGTFGTGSTGYLKDYNYDDRLRYQEPPHFLDPIQAGWRNQRATLDFP